MTTLSVEILSVEGNARDAGDLVAVLNGDGDFEASYSVTLHNESVDTVCGASDFVVALLSSDSFDTKDRTFKNFCAALVGAGSNVAFVALDGFKAQLVSFLPDELVIDGKQLRKVPAALRAIVDQSEQRTVSSATEPYKHEAPPVPENNHLIGKSDVMDLMQSKAFASPEPSNIILLRGSPECGKSTAVRMFAEEYRDKFSIVVWIPFDEGFTWRDFVVHLGKYHDQIQKQFPEIDLNSETDVLSFMEQKNALLIWDGYEHAKSADFDGLLRGMATASTRGRLIVTSKEHVNTIKALEAEGFSCVEIQVPPPSDDEYANFGASFGIPLTLEDAISIRTILGDSIESWRNLLLALSEQKQKSGDTWELPKNVNYYSRFRTGEFDIRFSGLDRMRQVALFLLSFSLDGLHEEDLIYHLRFAGSSREIFEAVSGLEDVFPVFIDGEARLKIRPWAAEIVRDLVLASMLDQLLSTKKEEASFLSTVLLVDASANEFEQEFQRGEVKRVIVEGLRESLGTVSSCENALKSLLNIPKTHAFFGFAPTNIVTILELLGSSLDLVEVDNTRFEHADFRRLTMRGAKFTNCDFVKCRFPDNFGPLTATAFLKTTGKPQIVAGTFHGELRTWSHNGDAHVTMNIAKDWISKILVEDADTLLVSSVDGSVSRVDVQAQSIDVLVVFHGKKIRSIAQSHGGVIWCCCDDGVVRVLERNGELTEIELSRNRILSSCTFFAGGREVVAFGGDEPMIRLIDAETRQEIGGINLGQSRARDMDFDESTNTLFIAHEYALSHWQLRDGPHEWHFLGKQEIGSRLWSIAFDGDLKRLFVGGSDSKIHVFTSDLQPIDTLLGHSSWVRSLSIESESDVILSGGEDQSYRLWRKKDLKCISVQKGLGRRVFSVAAVGNQIFFGTADHRIFQAVIAKNGQIRNTRPIYTHSDQVFAIASSDPASLVGSGSDDGKVMIWDTKKKVHLFERTQHAGWVGSVAFSTSGQLFASGGDDGVLSVLNIAQRANVLAKKLGDARISGIRFLGDETIVAAVETGSIAIVELKNRTFKKYKISDQLVYCIELIRTECDTHALCGTSDGQVIRFQLGNKESGQVLSLDDHSPIWAIGYDPVAQLVALGLDTGDLMVLDSSFKVQKQIFGAHNAQAWSVAWVNEPFGILSTGGDGSIAFWDPWSEKPKSRVFTDRACERAQYLRCSGIGKGQVYILKSLGAEVEIHE